MSLANGKLVVCLEVSPLGKREDTPGLLIFRQGGYDLDSISRSALAVTRTLLGEPPDRIEQTRPTKSGAATVDMVRVYQRRFWPCLASDRETSTKGGSWNL